LVLLAPAGQHRSVTRTHECAADVVTVHDSKGVPVRPMMAVVGRGVLGRGARHVKRRNEKTHNKDTDNFVTVKHPNE
jgi:hypothetical protein